MKNFDENYQDELDKLELFVDATGMMVMAQNLRTYIKVGKKVSAVVTGVSMLATDAIIGIRIKQMSDRRKKNDVNEAKEDVEVCKGEVVDIKKELVN